MISEKILFLDGPPFVLSKGLIKRVGLEEALVLQQVHYWLNPDHNKNVFEGKHWVRNTYKQWQKQFSFWTIKKLQRVFSTLEERGFLLSFIRYTQCHKTKYYTINYERFHAMTENPQAPAFQPSPTFGMKDVPKTDHGHAKMARPMSGFGMMDTPLCPGEYPDEVMFFEEENEQTQGFEPSPTFGMKDVPKMDHGHDKMARPMSGFGVIDDPKNGLSYILNTENTKTENTPLPPLSSSEPYARRKKEEEEEEKEEKLKKDKKEEEEEEERHTAFSKESQANHGVSQGIGTGLFEQLVDVWNEVIQHPLYGSRVFLSSERVQKFRRLLGEGVVCDVESWAAYCRKIRTTGFLIGENGSGFRATLDWALDPGNARKVLEGAYYTKPKAAATPTLPEISADASSASSWHAHAQALKQHCNAHGYDARWFEVCKFLSVTLGIPVFENWFKEVVPHTTADGTLRLRVKSPFFRDHIRETYERDLERAIQAAGFKRFEIAAGGGAPVGGHDPP